MSQLYRILDILFQPKNKSFSKSIQRKNTIFEQWDLILEHLLLNDCLIVKSTVDRSRVSLQSISQLNRLKNKYSSLKSTEVLQDRLRVSTNGPLIHVLYALAHYWKANGNRLALKLDEQSDPDSKVLTVLGKNLKNNISLQCFQFEKYCPSLTKLQLLIKQNHKVYKSPVILPQRWEVFFLKHL